MSKFCVICGKELTGKQRKLCSDIECHRDDKKEYDHKYYQNNVEKILKQQCRYQRNNRKRINGSVRKRRQNNPEKVKENNHKYYQNNSERIKENSRNYYQDNLEEIKEYKNKYYRRARGLPEDADLRKESILERIMRERLQENNIEFIAQHYINLENLTWTRVDFYIPGINVCLYTDGDYWHSLSEVQERDMRINKALEEMGYKVIRMTETKILKEFLIEDIVTDEKNE